MALFKKRRRTDAQPEWAGILDADEWAEFERLVRAHADRRGWSVDMQKGEVRKGEQWMPVINLAQICRTVPREQWAQLIPDHLDGVAAPSGAEDLGRDQARAALRARLLPEEFLRDVDWEVAARPVGGGLLLVLAYDLPAAVVIPALDKLRPVGEIEELFDLALEQTHAEPGLELSRHELGSPGGGPDTQLWLLEGQSFFTATHALWADRFDEPPSPHGTLVIVPRRHTVFAHPIRDVGVIGAVNHLLILASRMYVDGPGSVSDSLYWLRNGVFERLDGRVEGENVQFTPSDEFVEVLNGLAEGGDK